MPDPSPALKSPRAHLVLSGSCPQFRSCSPPSITSARANATIAKGPSRKRKDPTADADDSPSGRSLSFRAPRPISRRACDSLAWCAERNRQRLSTGGGISFRQSPPYPVQSRMREKPRSAPLRMCCRSSSVYLLGSFFGFRSRISICRVATVHISVEQSGRRVKRA